MSRRRRRSLLRTVRRWISGLFSLPKTGETTSQNWPKYYRRPEIASLRMGTLTLSQLLALTDDGSINGYDSDTFVIISDRYLT